MASEATGDNVRTDVDLGEDIGVELYEAGLLSDPLQCCDASSANVDKLVKSKSKSEGVVELADERRREGRSS